MDLSFNLNPKTNQLHELKRLSFYMTTFKNEDKMTAEFNMPNLEHLELDFIFMKYFPILNLPKLKQLHLCTVRV